MENTIQNKVKWFASYLGADLEIMGMDGMETKTLTPDELVVINRFEHIKARLILKPLESISDDLVEVIKEKFGIDDFRGKIGDFSFCIYRWDLPHAVNLISFLRFHGYCVEWNSRVFVEYGWLKPID